jgi:hypothetical protein
MTRHIILLIFNFSLFAQITPPIVPGTGIPTYSGAGSPLNQPCSGTQQVAYLNGTVTQIFTCGANGTPNQYGIAPAGAASSVPIAGVTGSAGGAVQGALTAATLRDWPSTADSSLATQIAAIGSTPTTLLIPRSGAAVSSSMTVPANVTLQMQQGGIITVAAGQTLSVNGMITAGSYQIFAGPGSVSFAGNNQLSVADMKWWGATGNGTTDDTTAVNNAFVAITTAPDRLAVHVPQGTYLGCNFYFSNPATPNCPTNSQCAAPAKIYADQGNSTFAAVFQANSSCGTNSTDYVAHLNSTSQVTIDGLKFDGGGTATPGTGASCLDTRWLALSITTAPSVVNHYQNLTLNNCLDSATGYAMNSQMNEDSTFRDIIVTGYGSGVGYALYYSDEGGWPSTIDNFHVSNSALMYLDTQQVNISNSFLNGGVQLGNLTGGSATSYTVFYNDQFEANAHTGHAIQFGTNVQNVTILGGQLGGSLTTGQSFFNGQLIGNVTVIGGRVFQGTGSLFGTITAGGYAPRPGFTFIGTVIDGTLPAATSTYDIRYETVPAASSTSNVSTISGLWQFGPLSQGSSAARADSTYYLNLNPSTNSSTTLLNGGACLYFSSGLCGWGMDFGYSQGTYNTRIFGTNDLGGGGVTLSTVSSPGTGQSNYTDSLYASASYVKALVPLVTGTAAIAANAGIENGLGHYASHGAAPTIGGTGCAASGTVNDNDGAITLSTGATSCTVTFSAAFVNPIPQLTASGTTILPVISNVTTTVLTIGVSAASGKVYYHVRDVN